MTPTTHLTLRCPKCHGEMLVYERQGIVVDQCRDCRGIWLDRGELDHLIDLEAEMARQTGRLEGATRGLGAGAWDGRARTTDAARLERERDERGRGDGARERVDDRDRDLDDGPDDDWSSRGDDRHDRRGGRRRGGLFGELFDGFLD